MVSIVSTHDEGLIGLNKRAVFVMTTGIYLSKSASNLFGSISSWQPLHRQTTRYTIVAFRVPNELA